MSILSWLAGLRRGKARDAKSSAAASAGGTTDGVATANVPPSVRADRRAERHARREMLHQVVRECMVRAEVLSSAYKFKVLALDQRGREFLVMVDIADAPQGHTHRLAEIEARIAQAAKARHGIGVSAVYWRIGDAVAEAPPARAPARAAAPAQPRPAPVDVPEWTRESPAVTTGVVAGVVAGSVIAASAAAQPAGADAPGNADDSGYDPLGDDELAAFQQALERAGGAGDSAWPSTVPVAPSAGQLPPIDPAYADTEVEDPDFQSDALGGTQYGSL